MLAEIVASSLVGYADLELVSVTAPRDGLVKAVGKARANAVVAAETQLRSDDVTSLLEAVPRLRVFTLAADARMTWLYELRPERVALGELSPEHLAAAIRAPRVSVPAGEPGSG
jgi:hypothetical protein